MFDIISLQDCERLFFCIEENIDVWKETAFFQAVKNHILRICNGKQLYNQINISKDLSGSTILPFNINHYFDYFQICYVDYPGRKIQYFVAESYCFWRSSFLFLKDPA